ncbi:hypothetical protein ELG97_35170 (plasmid) [Rhizobium leguminosarum]|jgi:hypothetical protein|uniref:Uncharacterized protein n=2 Tax=Rhizobium TaxID=379 RepID=A0A1C9I129_RHILT|nr:MULTISPECIES: hypothetical protein [Rhizobium]AOO92530.1 hypothetical protein [Rhizobium leguminosarum bv. trifolii]MBA8832613.1 hypothetical protein [Rhizobium leguminosarum]MDH6276464.1 hypothetical protein [Rhizobium leguminosarum]MVO92850.1 hypothetical protein [Rhizobium leguminosarum bv. phaseoli]NKK02315.1 hypothetical protein [Rhizobium leguminosarum bv. viciae]
MKTYLRLAGALIAALAASPAFSAQEPFLPSEKAAAILADGAPWSALAPDGKALKVTLAKDGTGSIRGPMPFALSITWTVKDDAMCISGKMGTHCLRFRSVPGGLQGWDGDKPDLKFSR